MLDVHFGAQILRLASVNCEAEILIKSVLQNKLLKNGTCHKHFVCLWRSHQRPHEQRILEDFEVVIDKEDEDFYLEIRQCPLKYEIFRRPMLVLTRQVAFIHSQKYSSSHHDVLMEECLNKSGSGSALRLRGKLAWTFVTRKRDSLRWQHADFLLKTDPKLGGLLMYNTTSSASMSKAGNSDFSEINYYIFVILSECDLYLDLSPSTKTYRILFKPKPLVKDNYEYLSINKGQTVKAVALDSRSDFVAWLSAIRLAKFGTDLSLAYHRNLNSRQYLQQQSTKPKSNVTKTSSSNIDFQKVKGLCQMMKLKSKATPISLSWSESVSSLATNSSTWSILSSSEGDNSVTGSSSVMLKRPRQVCCALLSDNPVKEPNPEATDNQEDEEEEEPDFVPLDMSKQGCEIITDPEEIKQMNEESALKSRFKSLKNLPLDEPWFTKSKSPSEIEELLQHNKFGINGYFLVSLHQNSFVLNVMYEDVLHHFKIVQKWMFGRSIFTLLEEGSHNFPSISSLVDFYSLNLTKPLPCHLTENPILM